MRVIFLDFDGVLHPANASPGSQLPFEWLNALAALLARHPEVGVVVHSSWRTAYSIDEIREFLASLGVRTMALAGPGAKSEAVQAHLDAHPDIEDFLILDDDEREFSASGWQGHLLLCNSATGIGHPHAQRQLADWLERPGAPCRPKI